MKERFSIASIADIDFGLLKSVVAWVELSDDDDALFLHPETHPHVSGGHLAAPHIIRLQRRSKLK